MRIYIYIYILYIYSIHVIIYPVVNINRERGGSYSELDDCAIIIVLFLLRSRPSRHGSRV
jgi:hypothetical protein